jgi:uncharacterized membrane protein
MTPVETASSQEICGLLRARLSAILRPRSLGRRTCEAIENVVFDSALKETRYGVLQSMRRSDRRWHHHLRGLQAAPVASGTGMADNVAGMLAYITIIPAIIFLVTEPYNKSRFVRFHSWQNLFLHLAAVVLWIALFIVSIVLAFIPILGHLISFLLWAGLSIGVLIVWIILLMKANQGVMYKLPVIGDLAEKQANAM